MKRLIIWRKKLQVAHNRMDATDQYSRKDSVILSGPAVPPMQGEEDTLELVQKLVKDHLNIVVSQQDISTTHRLGPVRASTPSKRNIFVKFARRDVKKELILKSKNRNRNATLFANESLTPLRKKMFNALRSMRKGVPDIVKGSTSMEGKVYAFTPPLAENGRDQRHYIEDWDALKTFCRDYVKKPLDSFLQIVAA